MPQIKSLLLSRGATQGMLALFDQSIASVTTFLTMLLLAQSCSQDEVGIYSLCFSLVMLANVIQERALLSPYLVFVHQRENQSDDKLLGSTLVHQAVLAFLVTLSVSAYLVYLFVSNSNQQMTTSVVVLLFATPAMMLRDFVRTISFTHLKMRGALVVDAAVFVLQIGGIGLLAYLDLLTVPRALLVVGASCAVATVLWLATKQQDFSIEWTEVPGDWKKHWAYSKWLVAGRLLGNGSRLFMPWVVAWMIDLSSAGALAVCATLAGISWVFVRGINNLMRPRAVQALNHGGTKALVSELSLTAIIFSICLGSMCVVYLFAGDWLLRILYGPDFTDATPALIVLGFNTLATSLAMTSSNGLAALERPKGNFLGEAATFVTTVVLAVPLINAYGITGAAGAILGGSLASVVVMTAVLSRELRTLDATTGR